MACNKIANTGLASKYVAIIVGMGQSIVVFLFMILLVACGGDNGSSADISDKQDIVSSFDKIGDCNKNTEGDTVFVKDAMVDYICHDGEWNPVKFELVNTSSSIQSSKALSSSVERNVEKPFSSSSSILIKGSSSSGIKTAWRYLNQNYSYGEIVDKRDGQRYKTTIVNSIQEWFSENLNYADSAKTPSLISRSWCYENSADSCSKYGRLYSWGAAFDSIQLSTAGLKCSNGLDCDLPSKWQGICPDGWRLPSEDDWHILLSSVSKKISGEYEAVSLKATLGWEDEVGFDSVGFSALPSGGRHDTTGGLFLMAGSNAYYWGYELSGNEDIFRSIMLHRYKTEKNGNYWVHVGEAKKGALSIRCMRDLVPVAEQKEVLKDGRDGKTYKTVKIGTQTWMAENLNYSDSVNTPSLVGKSWCYDNDEENCETYGRLYTWAAVVDSVALETEGLTCGYKKVCHMPKRVQGICPDGWHVPSENELTTLWRFAGGFAAGDALKSKDLWSKRNGTDIFGFAVLPGGWFSLKWDAFDALKEVAVFWSSTHLCDDISDDGSNCQYAYYLTFQDEIPMGRDNYSGISFYEKNIGHSLRCVKDE